MRSVPLRVCKFRLSDSSLCGPASIWLLLVCLHSIRHNCTLRYLKVFSVFCKLWHLLSLCEATFHHGNSRLCYFSASSPQEYLELLQSCSSRTKDGSHHGPVVSTLCGILVMPKSMYFSSSRTVCIELLIGTSRSSHQFLNINRRPGQPSSWTFNSSFSFSRRGLFSASASYVMSMSLSLSTRWWRATLRESWFV